MYFIHTKAITSSSGFLPSIAPRFARHAIETTDRFESVAAVPDIPGLTDHERHILQGAIKACREASRHIMAGYGKTHNTKDKTTIGDVLTEVDLKADETIRGILASTDPDADMITEETFDERVKTGKPIDLKRAWIVDPLDGSCNYSHGFPRFAVSIAYIKDGKPAIAVVMELPARNLYTAVRGKGAWSEGKRLRHSGQSNMGKALLSTEFAKDFRQNPRDKNNIANMETMMHVAQSVRRADTSVLDGVYAAAGKIDGYWHLGTHPWDQAASMLIAEEAGCNVSGPQGQPVDLSQFKFAVVGGTPSIYEKLLEKLKFPQCE